MIMTTTKITNRMKTEADKVALKFETALKIRALLDEARKAYGSSDWDDNSLESEVMELVTEE
jgi:hypothetical protein